MRTFLITVVVIISLFYTATCYAADTNIRYKDMPVSPPSVPSIQGSYGGSDVCSVSRAGGVSAGFLGFSGAYQQRDMNCERIKLSRALAQLGLKISATAILCQDPRVFVAMVSAGSPCPVNGKIGDEAIKEYRKRGVLDANNNLVVSHNVVNGSVQQLRRDDYGQPTN